MVRLLACVCSLKRGESPRKSAEIIFVKNFSKGIYKQYRKWYNKYRKARTRVRGIDRKHVD